MALYGAAAMQLLLASVAASDGTRKRVATSAFSGITVPASTSVIGPAYGIDRTTGEATVRDVSIEILQDQQEQFAASIQL
jgi:branched-chain amino acid transport system substrate-binding protein